MQRAGALGTHCRRSWGSHSRPHNWVAAASEAALWRWEAGLSRSPLAWHPAPQVCLHPTYPLLRGLEPPSGRLSLLLGALGPQPFRPSPAGGRPGLLLAPDVLNWGRGGRSEPGAKAREGGASGGWGWDPGGGGGAGGAWGAGRVLLTVFVVLPLYLVVVVQRGLLRLLLRL